MLMHIREVKVHDMIIKTIVMINIGNNIFKYITIGITFNYLHYLSSTISSKIPSASATINNIPQVTKDPKMRYAPAAIRNADLTSDTLR